MLAQLTDEGQYLMSGVGHDDDSVAGLMEDVKDVNTTFEKMKFTGRRKLVDLKQTFETTVVEVSVCLFVCLTVLRDLTLLVGLLFQSDCQFSVKLCESLQQVTFLSVPLL